MLLAVLDHVPGLDQARRIVARLLAAVPPGSFLVISHAASDIDPDETAEMIGRLNEHLAEGNFTGRPRDVVARFFDGLDPVAPGVVKVTQWHPRSELEARGPASLWGGVARKPQTCRRAEPTRKPGQHSRPGPGPRGDDDPAPGNQPSPGRCGISLTRCGRCTPTTMITRCRRRA